MSQELKLRRGTTAEHAVFTGAFCEVTVDTEKKTIVVHDGETPGGNPLLTPEQGFRNHVAQVATIAYLRALEPAFDGQQVSVSSYHDLPAPLRSVGGGVFTAKFGDYSSETASDALTGVYVAFPSDPTGASGAWVRNLDGYVMPEFFGAIGNGINDDGPAINLAIANHKSVFGNSNANYLTTVPILPRTFSLIDFNGATVTCSGAISAITLDNCLYSTVKNIKRLIVPSGGIGIVVDSTNAALSESQFNRFYDIDIECDGRSNTKALVLGKCWSNQFYSCNFLRATVGIQIGSGLGSNACNANHFYGCEVRSVNTLGGTGIHHVSGDNNAFIGGIVENLGRALVIDGGSFLFNSVYLEGFSDGHAMQQNGGQLTVTDCFNNPSVFISDGDSFRLSGHHFIESTLSSGGSYNESFPAILLTSDSDIRISVDVNVPSDKFFVIREGEYRVSPGVWAKRTVGYEDIRWISPKFSARLSSDQSGVTGDGTSYQVNYGNNKEFVRPSIVFDNNGVFTSPIFGLYRFSGQVRLSGLVGGSVVSVRVATSNRSYYAHSDKVSADQLGSGGTYTFGFDCFAELEANDTAMVYVQVSGQSAGSVSVMRGDAVNGYTTFSGFKV